MVFAKNPQSYAGRKALSIRAALRSRLTAVKEERRGKVPAASNCMIRSIPSSSDPPPVQHPIAANYTATLAVLYSRAKGVAGSAAGSFLRPDNPRFATGIYMIHPYDPNKVPDLVHSWSDFVPAFVAKPGQRSLRGSRKSSSTINLGFSFIRPVNRPLESAAQLREDLQATQRLFDPKGTAIASRHLVRHRSQHGQGCSRTLWYQTRATRFGRRLRPGR